MHGSTLSTGMEALLSYKISVSYVSNICMQNYDCTQISETCVARLQPTATHSMHCGYPLQFSGDPQSCQPQLDPSVRQRHGIEAS